MMTLLPGLFALGLLAGVMIGCIGIGGVILVPGMVYFAGVPIHGAIAAAMMGYVLSGIAGMVVFWREQSGSTGRGNATVGGQKPAHSNTTQSGYWHWPLWLCIGAMPTALVGAWASNIMPPDILELVIGILIAASGVHSLVNGRTASQETPDSADAEALEANAENNSPAGIALIGAATGFGSAITGTGGPLILVPLLLWLRQPVLRAIRLGQMIQLPVATLATIGNFIYGDPDVRLGLIMAVAILIGTFAGTSISARLPRQMLRALVSGALIVIGILMLIRALW